MKFSGYFSVSTECKEVFNRLPNFLEMEEDSIPRHMPPKFLSLSSRRKMLKYWPSIKSWFQIMRWEEFISLILKYMTGENEETDYCRINLYAVSLKPCDELRIDYKEPGKRWIDSTWDAWSSV